MLSSRTRDMSASMGLGAGRPGGAWRASNSWEASAATSEEQLWAGRGWERRARVWSGWVRRTRVGSGWVRVGEHSAGAMWVWVCRQVEGLGV